MILVITPEIIVNETGIINELFQKVLISCISENRDQQREMIDFIEKIDQSFILNWFCITL
jgi:hypothetical protein